MEASRYIDGMKGQLEPKSNPVTGKMPLLSFEPEESDKQNNRFKPSLEMKKEALRVKNYFDL